MSRIEEQESLSKIVGVVVRSLTRHSDPRGWLMELWRQDQLPQDFWPQMTYISQTAPGVARGPHEHVDQADYFCFLGPGTFRLHLWDNRPPSTSYERYEVFELGEEQPAAVIIPAGVVHAYQNISRGPGWVINCPNRLYRGEGYAEEVDEIRHEDDPQSPFQLGRAR
ncbi:dTDP-4-dehydrorhamnose 3,5-epimerase [Lujinxingia litoralis]|uniref:dTDP-4-dehydrorhamnose 3,5-epimerase n=1 Tax=Lujinxingia litoralis TaxID=2211119 RepID=A0A328C451_9DELT|nr:dTDP-4-dehydrorhamnose 3,5-epimerase family protein [Lujinxingia litoralis]RAL20517.1 dTDP-4-dehydrorhamnose 3,5-epimerase [Lujinxingia litoralis]